MLLPDTIWQIKYHEVILPEHLNVELTHSIKFWVLFPILICQTGKFSKIHKPCLALAMIHFSQSAFTSWNCTTLRVRLLEIISSSATYQMGDLGQDNYPFLQLWTGRVSLVIPAEMAKSLTPFTYHWPSSPVSHAMQTPPTKQSPQLNNPRTPSQIHGPLFINPHRLLIHCCSNKCHWVFTLCQAPGIHLSTK